MGGGCVSEQSAKPKATKPQRLLYFRANSSLRGMFGTYGKTTVFMTTLRGTNANEKKKIKPVDIIFIEIFNSY